MIVILVSTVDIVRVTPKFRKYTSVAVEIGLKVPTAKVGKILNLLYKQGTEHYVSIRHQVS